MHVVFNVSGIASRGARGAECSPTHREKLEKRGGNWEKKAKIGKKRKNQEEKAKTGKVLSLYPS